MFLKRAASVPSLYLRCPGCLPVCVEDLPQQRNRKRERKKTQNLVRFFFLMFLAESFLFFLSGHPQMSRPSTMRFCLVCVTGFRLLSDSPANTRRRLRSEKALGSSFISSVAKPLGMVPMRKELQIRSRRSRRGSPSLLSTFRELSGSLTRR